MTISARNQLHGVVDGVTHGAVNDEVTLTLNGGGKLTAVVTQSSQKALGLEAGKQAVALIKAPWVILASENNGYRFSARNQFPGKVQQLSAGAVNSTVELITDAGFSLVAVVTNEACEEMKLGAGSRVIALVKASSILLAVKA
ncbi:transporter [Salmonella enterica subsp. enterica serovar Choleraesuis]|nr:transporter [Salmonella enterica subsp. enterica serovar Choleraesuis]